MKITILACSLVSTAMLRPTSYTVASYRLINLITPVASKDTRCLYFLPVQPLMPIDPACNLNRSKHLSISWKHANSSNENPHPELAPRVAMLQKTKNSISHHAPTPSSLIPLSSLPHDMTRLSSPISPP